MNQTADNGAAVPSWLSCGGDYVAVRVVARPGSSRRGIIREERRGLVIGINAPPEKGRANAELAELLAAMLRLPKSAITIARGGTGRFKTVRIATAAPREIASALAAAAERA